MEIAEGTLAWLHWQHPSPHWRLSVPCSWQFWHYLAIEGISTCLITQYQLFFCHKIDQKTSERFRIRGRENRHRSAFAFTLVAIVPVCPFRLAFPVRQEFSFQCRRQSLPASASAVLRETIGNKQTLQYVVMDTDALISPTAGQIETGLKLTLLST